MAKQKKLPLLFGRFQQKTVLSVTLVAVLGLFAVLQLFWNIQLQWRIESLEARNMAAMIIDSAESIAKPMAIDPSSGRQYIPQSRLSLPPAFEDLEVAYMQMDGAAVAFSSRGNVDSAAQRMQNAKRVGNVFEAVAPFQICSRQVVIRYDTMVDSKFALKGTKSLADGRVASIYEEMGCPADSSRLVNYLMQVESY